LPPRNLTVSLPGGSLKKHLTLHPGDDAHDAAQNESGLRVQIDDVAGREDELFGFLKSVEDSQAPERAGLINRSMLETSTPSMSGRERSSSTCLISLLLNILVPLTPFNSNVRATFKSCVAGSGAGIAALPIGVLQIGRNANHADDPPG
jgi:hypothetical protein